MRKLVRIHLLFMVVLLLMMPSFVISQAFATAETWIPFHRKVILEDAEQTTTHLVRLHPQEIAGLSFVDQGILTRMTQMQTFCAVEDAHQYSTAAIADNSAFNVFTNAQMAEYVLAGSTTLTLVEEEEITGTTFVMGPEVVLKTISMDVDQRLS